MSVNGTLLEDKMHRFKGESAHFSFSKCLFYTHDGASDKFRANSHEADYSVAGKAAQRKLAPLSHIFDSTHLASKSPPSPVS